MATGLFKYFPPDGDKTEWFTGKQILLTPPEYFNDPWDFLVRFEPYTDAQLEIKAQEMRLPIEHLKQTVASNDFLTAESRDYQKEIGKKIGVVCFAENPLDRLMWAHYAESHRGFVAEFAHDKELFEDGFRQRVGPFGPAAKVQYLKPHEQQPECKRDTSNIAEVLWKKHSKWNYEQEWRVIQSHDKAIRGLARDGTPRSLMKFEPNDLVRVIFGLHICPTIELKLKQMLSRSEFRNVRTERADIDPVTNELISHELP